MHSNPYSYRDAFYKKYVSTKILTTNHANSLESKKPFLTHVVKKYFSCASDATIIDLGCGDGALLFFAKQLGYHNVIGFDISPEQVNCARTLGIDSIFLKDAMQAVESLESNSADVIITFDVIEHMTKNEIVEFSNAIHRILKTGGKWIIHTLNAEAPFFGRIRYGDFTHENGFTTSSIKQLLTLVGFNKINYHEDVPVKHGVKSTIRFFLWKFIRSIYRFCLAVETGEKNGIFSQNFLVVAEK